MTAQPTATPSPLEVLIDQFKATIIALSQLPDFVPSLADEEDEWKVGYTDGYNDALELVREIIRRKPLKEG